MKFLANENFPIASIRLLRKKGVDITSIGEDNPSVSDEEVIQFAIREQRTILTFDKDYGELVFRRGYHPTGVVFLRIDDFLPEDPAKFILRLIKNKIVFEGYFTVLEADRIRQRKILRIVK